MQQNCAKTCCDSNLTPPPALTPPPYDCGLAEPDSNTQLCSAYSSHCNAGQKYTAWMTANCKSTCCEVSQGLNTCSKTVDTASANMCSSYQSHCAEGQRYTAWMNANCANTCCTSKA